MKLDKDKFKGLLYDNLITQGELAKKSGISPSTISALMKGKHNLGMTSINGLVKVFGKEPITNILIRD